MTSYILSKNPLIVLSCLNLSTDKYIDILIHAETNQRQNVDLTILSQPPMRATTILYPIDVEEEKQIQLKQLKDAKKRLYDMKEGEGITFEQLLLNLSVSEETYLLSH